MKLPTYKEVWYFGLKLVVPNWVKCIATDKCGEIWGYETIDIFTRGNSWNCNSYSEIVLIFENVDLENTHWTKSKLEVE